MPALIRYRHQVVFHWLVLMHLVLSGPKMLKGLSLATPSRIAERPFRRFHCARYWSVHFLLRWLAEETLKSTSRGQSGLCRLRWKQKEETGCEKTCSTKGKDKSQRGMVLRHPLCGADCPLGPLPQQSVSTEVLSDPGFVRRDLFGCVVGCAWCLHSIVQQRKIRRCPAKSTCATKDDDAFPVI